MIRRSFRQSAPTRSANPARQAGAPTGLVALPSSPNQGRGQFVGVVASSIETVRRSQHHELRPIQCLPVLLVLSSRAELLAELG